MSNPSENQLPENAVFEARDGLVAETIEGETVVMDLDGDEYFSLNEVAGALWSVLQEGATIDTLVENITNTYEVEEERAREDIREFLTGATEAGIVVTENTSAE